MDTETIFIILALYANECQCQDEIEAQTLSFNSRGWTKI